MKERPILFSAPMVRAILEGRKTQTRRLIKPTPQPIPAGSWEGCEGKHWFDCAAVQMMVCVEDELQGFDYSVAWCLNPFGKPGEQLWVREAWRAPDCLDDLSPRKIGEAALDAGYRKPWCPIQYEADGARTSEKDWREFGSQPSTSAPGRYRHARFMPRWASRIMLEVTNVRVERLQAISEADAQAEGADRLVWDGNCGPADLIDWPLKEEANPYRNGYALLWESINGDGSWEANPWVWVVEFKHIEP